MMIEYLLKHRDTSRNNDAPLILKYDVPRWRNIVNKRMAYLRSTYRLFKDTVSETEKDIIALMKEHMKMCIKKYHALILQLDLIAIQWGVSIEDTLSHNDFGLPKLEKKNGEDKVIKRNNYTTKLRNLGGGADGRGGYRRHRPGLTLTTTCCGIFCREPSTKG
jgi:hypothetical protein